MTKVFSISRSDSQSIEFFSCGRTWRLLRPADLETLWQGMTDAAFTKDERLPYWVELWPASLALAEWLQQNKERLQSGLCLDLGCGLGFTAQVATWLGAEVIAVDYEAQALSYARQSAAVNGVPDPLWTLMDWRKPAVRAKSCACIWGGDIMYEQRFVRPVFAFLEHALAENGVVWLAEPARNVYATFKAMVEEQGWQSRCVLRAKIRPLHTQPSKVSVNLWELTRS